MIKCRHCTRSPAEMEEPSAASVLILGEKSILSAVEELEAEGVLPCLTAVCPNCQRISILTEEGHGACAHVLGLWARMRPFLEGVGN